MAVTLEALLRMAEDELTEYSTEARKIEKLRRKIGLALPYAQQKELKQELIDKKPKGFLFKKLEESRQTFALPFWGIAGLGLLLGISSQQYLDFIATAIALPLAIKIQQLGWKLEAQTLLLKTFEDIEERMKS